jgi:membrane-bound inhibitor of C-type lysozyme
MNACKGSLIATTTGLLLSACVVVQPEVTMLPAEINYVCQNNVSLKVLRAADGRTATVWLNGKSSVLDRADSAAQEKFSNGPTTLYLDGEKAVMSTDSFVVAGPCLSAQPLPVVPMSRY